MSVRDETLADPVLIEAREQWESGQDVIGVNVNEHGDEVVTVTVTPSKHYQVMRYFTGPFSEGRWNASQDLSVGCPEEVIKWLFIWHVKS